MRQKTCDGREDGSVVVSRGPLVGRGLDLGVVGELASGIAKEIAKGRGVALF